MRVEPTTIEGAVLVRFDTYLDDRGIFEETYNMNKFHDIGLPSYWQQDNISTSYGAVLRGLHYQKNDPQGKLVRCLRGSVFDVCVDIREGSRTFGSYFSAILSEGDSTGLYIPPGCAHGFRTLSPIALVSYKCTSVYNKESDAGVRWNDPDLKIKWPGENHIISQKDQSLPFLKELTW